jgi:hypothetical protein
MSNGGLVQYCDSDQLHEEGCKHYAEGGEVEANRKFVTNPKEALAHYGASQGLLGQLTKLGHSENSLEEYRKQAHKGSKRLESHVTGFLHNEKIHSEPDEAAREKLSERIESLKMDPSQLEQLGGNLGETLPDHAVALAAHVVPALSYLSSIKPKGVQNAPLDRLMSPGKGSEANYHRQLDIANNPLLVLKYAKEGNLTPPDIMTLRTIHPEAVNLINQKVMEKIIDVKNPQKLSYTQRIGLSHLIGQPLDSTMTPYAAQAVIASQAQQAQQRQQSTKPKGATAAQLKAVSKNDDLYPTSLQARQIDKRS